jgi:2-succinyl-6-hydroxy-2,4-cyclohexadiene-1-carboxylate synthase
MAQRVVLVHGFTQTAHSWDPVVELLPPGLEVVRPELPGHGGSASRRLGFVEAAAAVAEEGGEAVYAGYSMGGRVCLRLALDHPDRVQALVLIGTSPGIADPAARQARRRSDEDLADSIAAIGVVGFLDTWLAQPMFETTVPRAHDLEHRRGNPPAGLAHALRNLGTGAQEPLWDRLRHLAPPTVLVVGERDAKFRAIAERMAEATGWRAGVQVVPDAGHAVILDQPAACAALIADVVAAHSRTP